jgi:hypothetical protein
MKKQKSKKNRNKPIKPKIMPKDTIGATIGSQHEPKPQWNRSLMSFSSVNAKGRPLDAHRRVGASVLESFGCLPKSRSLARSKQSLQI